MTIKLFTGLDGTGKTLAMVDMACTLKEQAEKDAKAGKGTVERKLYYWGIDGLKDGIAESIEHPSKWVDLPPGSILLIDECSKVFGTDELNGRKLPEWVKELREHRHHAVDIVMSCQDPTQLHLYVRKLVKWHVHHVRKFGSRNIQRFEWSSCVNTPTATASIKRGKQTLWRLPKHRFEMYVSAKEHHEKLRIPLRMAIFPLALVIVPWLAWIGWGKIQLLMDRHSDSQARSVSADPAVVPGMPSMGGEAKRPATAKDWVAERTPRVAGIPWSAPMWDGLQAEGVPDLFCVEAEQEDGSKRCSCYTEQVTKVEGVATQVCSKIANEGIYNPYRRSGEPKREGRSSAEREDRPVASASSQSGSGGTWDRAGGIGQPYTPPELTKVSAIGGSN